MDEVPTSASHMSPESVTSDDNSSGVLGEELCCRPQHLQDGKVLSNEKSESDNHADVVNSDTDSSVAVTSSDCKVSSEKSTQSASGAKDIFVSAPETSEITEVHDLTEHVEVQLSDESSVKLTDDLNSSEPSNNKLTESSTECTGDVDNDTASVIAAPSLDLFDDDNEGSLPKNVGKEMVSKDSCVPGSTHSVDEDSQDSIIECLNTETNSKSDESEKHTSISQSIDQECTNVDRSKELDGEFVDMDRPSSKSNNQMCVNQFDKNTQFDGEDLDSSSSTHMAMDVASNGGNENIAVVPDLNKTSSKALAANIVQKSQNNVHGLQEVNVESEPNKVNAEDENHNSLNGKCNDIVLVNLDNDDEDMEKGQNNDVHDLQVVNSGSELVNDDEDMEKGQNNDVHDLQEVNGGSELNIVNFEGKNRDSVNSKSNDIELVNLDNDDVDMEKDNPKLLYTLLNSPKRSFKVLDDNENKNSKKDEHILSDNSDSGKETEIIENEDRPPVLTVHVNKDNDDADKIKGASENGTISDKSQIDNLQNQVGVEDNLPSECDVVLDEILSDLGKDDQSLPERPHANVPTRASNQNSNVEVIDLSDDEIEDIPDKEKDNYCTLELQCEDDPVAENHVDCSTLTIFDSDKEAVKSVNVIGQNSEVQFNENEKAPQTGISLGPVAVSSPLMPVLVDCSTYVVDGNLCMVPLVQLPGVPVPGPPAPIPISTATNLDMPLDKDKEDSVLSEMTFEIEKMQLPSPPSKHPTASSYEELRTIVSKCKDLQIPLVRCDNTTGNNKSDRQNVLPNKVIKCTKGSNQNTSNDIEVEEKNKPCKADASQNENNTCTPVFGQVFQFSELSFSSLCAKTNQNPDQGVFSTSTPKDQACTDETQASSVRNKCRKRSQEGGPASHKAKKAKTAHKVEEVPEAETNSSVLPTKPPSDNVNHNSAKVNDESRLQRDTKTTLREQLFVNSLPTSKKGKEVEISCTVENASSSKPTERDLSFSEDDCEAAKSDGEVSFFTSEDSGSELEDVVVVKESNKADDLLGECEGAPGTGSQYLIPAVVSNANEVNLWKCFLCEKAFQEHSKLKKHFAFHVKKVVLSVLKTRDKFDCIFCGKPLHSKEALKFHMKKKHQVSEGTKYSCLFCSGLFLTNDDLKQHIKIQHWSQPEQSKTEPSPKTSTEKQKSENKQNNSQVERSPKIVSRVLVKRKIDFEEPSPRKKQNVASSDDDKISVKGRVDSNQGLDKLVNTVNVKNVQSLNVLPRQTRSLVKAPKDKPKANKDKNAQASSSGTSNASKRYSSKYRCKQCHVDFRNLALLTKHKITKHGGGSVLKNKRTLKCPYCNSDKMFTSTLYLNRHINIYHPKAKNPEAKDSHVCKVCKQSFPYESHLDQHFRIHHAESTADLLPNSSSCSSKGCFKCPMCPKTYKKVYFLEYHMRLKHPGLMS